MERTAPAYSDVSLALKRNPLTGDIIGLVDAQAIRESIRAIFKIRRFDIPYASEKHAHIEEFLFDPVSVNTAASLKDRIEWALKTMEPRVTFVVEVTPGFSSDSRESDGYNCIITYEIATLSITGSIKEFLERIR